MFEVRATPISPSYVKGLRSSGYHQAQPPRYTILPALSLLASVGKLTVAHLGLDVALAPGSVSGEPSYYEGVRNRNFGYDASDDTVWKLDWRP